jgi:Peptidase inhibitor I78 family
MVRPYRFAALFILSLAPVLQACKADPVQTSPVGSCKEAAAQSLVGQVRPTEAEVMQVTNATSVRLIGPGEMTTLDHREDRVTIEADPSSGRVIAARCG